MNAEKRSRRALEPDLLGPPPKLRRRRRRRRQSAVFRWVIQPPLELAEALRKLVVGPGSSEKNPSWSDWPDAQDPQAHGHGHRPRRSLAMRTLIKYVIQPPLDLFDSVRSLLSGSLPPLLVGAAVLTGWWFWPWISAMTGLSGARQAGAQEVITTFVEDPQRTIAAMRHWQARPGSLLVLQGRPSSQAENQAFLESQDLWPRDQRGMVALTPGCDTVGQISALERLLRQRRSPGRLTVVTSPAHMERTLAISQIIIGSHGWEIQGLPVATGDNRPESIWRTFRDQVRAQLVRNFAWDPVAEMVCRTREDGGGAGGVPAR